MSEVKVNKISPRSGTSLTIGDNGDTTNIVGTLQNNGAALVGDISSVVAGTNLSGGGTSGAVTINLADASTSAKGAASFSSDNFAASSGAVTIKDLGIATAELQDNAITLAKMASGTDGNIISYDASGNPVAIATGSDGQVLTSAGAGAQPAFETLPAGTTLSGSTNNTVATVTGANALQGEANLTFNGTTLETNSGGSVTPDTNANELVVQDNASAGISILSANNDTGNIYFGDAQDNNIGKIEYNHATNSLIFTNNNVANINIDNNNNVSITKAGTSDTVTGSQFTANGGLVNVLNANGYNIINRQAGGGTFIYFKQVNSTDGSISVSGATVSYNSFTGTHWSRLSDNSKPTILKGTVLETLDEMVDWYNLEFNDSNGEPQKISHLLTDGQSNGDIITYNHKGTDVQATIIKEEDIKHCQTKISTTSEAKNVYGVFHCWDFGDDDGVNDMQVAAVGTYVVRIKSGETVTKGDLLQSNGDGTAKVQSDDNIKSSSFAKVLSNTKIETYDDGSFIVPCSLNC